MPKGTRKPPRLNPDDNAWVWKRKRNSKFPVNQLPPEILSSIMSIGADSDRRIWGWTSRRQVGSQVVASHVCSHWRDLAINSPILWTFIHISSDPPSARNRLYLARAGANTLLDILIDIRIVCSSASGSGVDAQRHAYDILQFLAEHDAGAHRWRSLYVSCPKSHVLPVFFGHLNQNSPASLKLLRFECGDADCKGLYDQDGPLQVASSSGSSMNIDPAADQSYTLLGSSLSSLRILELGLVSWPLFIKRISPLPALRELSITPSTPYSVDLANVLMSNPQLQSLYLKSGFYYYTQYSTNRLDLIQPVVLTSLRALYIYPAISGDWVFHVLSTIKAPKLRHLTIMYSHRRIPDDDRRRLISYITTGRNSLDLPGSSGSANLPAYPSIRSLDTSRFPCGRDEFIALITPFPFLTHLTIRRKQAEWLSEVPWLVPRLKSLTVLPWTIEAATITLRQCARAGYPIKLAKFRRAREDTTRAGLRIKTATARGHSKANPQYEYFEYDGDAFSEARGDWQSMWRQSSLLIDDSDAPIECDNYDSEEYESECGFTGAEMFD